MKKPDPINKVHNQDEFSSGLMESYGRWMDGDTFQGTHMPDIHEAPFDGMDPQSNGAEIEDTTKKKKEVKKVTPLGAKELKVEEEYEVLEREEYEIDGETWILEKRRYFTAEGDMATARANVGASTCWKGYKAKGTKKKGGKTVPNCVKEEEVVAEHHQKDKNGNTIPHEDTTPSSVEEGAAWTKKSGKNPSGGLNEKGRKSYERENPGSDLKRPSKKVGNKRRASFCARMRGMKKKLTSAKTARDPDSRINKSLRAWNC